MKTTLPACKLDVAEFARRCGVLDGTWSPGDLPRLVAACVRPPALATTAATTVASPRVRWHARGVRRVFAGTEQTWLHLEITAEVTRTCQRCLAPVVEHLALVRDYRFVATEAEAEREDGASAEDVLALPRALDLAALCEDEILMALPVVPLHDVCPQPLVPGADRADFSVALAPDGTFGGATEIGREQPFAALAALRGKLH